MAPEQAKGKDVDKRADIWAFGCCFYEALAGGMPFDEETVTETLASVMKQDMVAVMFNSSGADPVTPLSVERDCQRRP